MGILTKMLGTKIFLLLSLSVLGYSIPQPELKIIIHLHYDDFQPGPVNLQGFQGRRRPSIVPEAGFDYSDDQEDSGADDQHGQDYRWVPPHNPDTYDDSNYDDGSKGISGYYRARMLLG